MRAIISYTRKHPTILIYVFCAWILFALITTILTTYPLLSEYALKSPQVFRSLETWTSFLVYTYNSLLGGIVNYLNTFLFGIWVLAFIVYRRTYIDQGLAIAAQFKSHKTGTLGSLAAILGGGCIGCGFTFLTNIFGASLGLFLNALPLKGAEISLLGTVIILISIFRTARQIEQFSPEQTTVVTPSTVTPTTTPTITPVESVQSESINQTIPQQ